MESPSTPEAVQSLARVPLFAGISPRILEHLASVGRVRKYPAGQILFNEGDEGDALLVLLEGQLRISRLGANGQEAVLAVVEPPAAVGELSLLDGAPRDATIVAQRAVVVRLIPRAAFLALLRAEPEVSERLLVTLATMVRAGNRRHARTIGLDVPGRFAAWLLDRLALVGQEGQPGATIQLNRTQGELAAELGTTRSTLNRTMGSFEELRLIRVDDDRITIADPARLRPYTE